MPSSDYSLQNSGQTQSDWRWFHKCQGLFFASCAIEAKRF